jgi:Single-strand binding protein family
MPPRPRPASASFARYSASRRGLALAPPPLRPRLLGPQFGQQAGEIRQVRGAAALVRRCWVSITRRLTRDPELVSDGKGARFGIASNRSDRLAGEDEWQEEIVNVTCIAWQGLGKRIATRLTKGSFVALSGRLELNT